MKITMYELLGLIKDGKAPKKIKVTGRIYEFDKDYGMYYTKEKDRSYSVALGGLEDEINLIANAFNENVEIIEESKKINKIRIDYNSINIDKAFETGTTTFFREKDIEIFQC